MSFLRPNLRLDQARIVAAIAAAERRTSGEIRVVLSHYPTDNAIAAAQKQFDRLGMANTAARNGVLIFLCPRSHTFAVIGDRGIHEKCGEEFWGQLATAMTEHFRRGEFTNGIVFGVERAGELLAQHFPRVPDDRNELPDKVEEV